MSVDSDTTVDEDPEEAPPTKAKIDYDATQIFMEVLLTPELRSLIFEKLVLQVGRFSDVQLVLGSLAFCTNWREGSATVRAAIEKRWALSCHTVLWLDEGDQDVFVPGIFFTPSAGCGFYKRESQDPGAQLPYGLLKLLAEMGIDVWQQPLQPLEFEDGITAVTQVEGATYIVLRAGGVAKFDGGVHQHAQPAQPAQPAHRWEWTGEDSDEDDDQGPHSSLAVALGLCFVTDHVQRCVTALDASNLQERFSFGRAELSNPVGVAWHEGLLWVANCDFPHEGKLVAYSFEIYGPRVVHIIANIDMPVGLAAAHGCLYISCREEHSIHVLRTAEYIAQGDHSTLDSVPHQKIVLRKRPGQDTIYHLMVHPELPLVVAGAGVNEHAIAVFWSGSVLGCENYHEAYEENCAADAAWAAAEAAADAEAAAPPHLGYL